MEEGQGEKLHRQGGVFKVDAAKWMPQAAQLDVMS